MAKELILFVGRPTAMSPISCPAWDKMKGKGNVYAAAYNEADLRDLLVSYTVHGIAASEIQRYWEKSWGDDMAGVTPRRGIWLSSEKFGDNPVIHVYDGESKIRVGHLKKKEAFVTKAPELSEVNAIKPDEQRCKILKIQARLESSVANPYARVLHIYKKLDAVERNATYLVEDRVDYQVKKKNLLVINFNENDKAPTWELHCRPEQAEEAQAALTEACRKYVKSVLERAQRFNELFEAGVDCVSSDEYMSRFHTGSFKKPVEKEPA